MGILKLECDSLFENIDDVVKQKKFTVAGQYQSLLEKKIIKMTQLDQKMKRRYYHYEAEFLEGSTGLTIIGNTVVKIEPNSQAEKNDIQVGWGILSINSTKRKKKRIIENNEQKLHLSI